MKKIIVALVMLLMTIIPAAFATQTRFNGDISLTWTNYPTRPQQFSGTVTGDLIGNIALTSNTDYDLVSTHVGVTHSEDVVLTLSDDTVCEGFYAGANVNDGRNTGTFTLGCDDSSFIQGEMYGVNDLLNMNLHYSAFKITALDGIQGPQGEVGAVGPQGEQGLIGLTSSSGQSPLASLDPSASLRGEDSLKKIKNFFWRDEPVAI